MKKTFKQTHLEALWNAVPVNYYQRGIRTSFLQRLWHQKKIEHARFLLQTIPFTHCLDVGCASGYMLGEIAKAYPDARYTGVDVYKKAILHAKKTYPMHQFFMGNAQKLPFADGSFDLVLCYETIEHVVDPNQTLREIKRVLKKRGTAIIAMDSGSLLFRIVWFFWEKTKGRVWQGAHLHPFHHHVLEKRIKASGLRIKSKQFSHLGMEVIFVVTK